MTLPNALRHAALIAPLVFASVAHAGPPAGAPPDPDPDVLARMPLGFAALAMEKEVGADVSDAHAALTRVVDAVRPRLPALTPQDALQTIAEAATLACPTLVNGASGGLISDALRDGQCDCDILVVTYLTVADVLGLPLSAVFLPEHMLVVWDDGRSLVYWETTVPEERPAWLVEARVPEGADRAYLRPQTRREMVGYFLQVRANYRIESGAPDEALEDYDRAARLNPTFVLTYSNRGRAHLLGGRYGAALTDYDRALRLDPTNADALYGRGLTLVALDRHSEALRALARVRELQGPAADVLHAEGLAHAGLGQEQEALERFDAALDLDPGMILVYEARGTLHERLGDVERARSDYAAFLHLADGTAPSALISDVRSRVERLSASG